MESLLKFLLFTFVTVNAYDKGRHAGCFKKNLHGLSQNLTSAENCFDFCFSQFYRYSVLYDKNGNQFSCSCENILKGSEIEGKMCSRQCQDREEESISCGGDETESVYETGSDLPGSVKSVKVQETTQDKITIEFDPPERNGTELSGYEIGAFVIFTFNKNPWAHDNQTWKVMKSAQTFDLSNLLSATRYQIIVKSKSIDDRDGGSASVETSTRLRAPEPKPDAPKILNISESTARIQIDRYDFNNNGPITKYLIVVSFLENDFVKSDFDESLLTTYDEARNLGLNYWIAAEIDTFQEQQKIFLIGDDQKYGKYFNKKLSERQDRGHLHIMVGVLSRFNGEEKISYSNISHEEIISVASDEKSNDDFLITVLSIAVLLCGLLLLGSVVFYGYIRITRIDPRNSGFEMSIQGPILEVDNSGFISCDFGGVNFKEKLQEVLLHLEPNQTISRKNLALDIDHCLGIGCFGDVIKGQMNGNAPTQVHVVSPDDLDPPTQIKFLRDLQNLLQFGYHQNILSFFGICQTHDWFFLVFEDTVLNLKQYLLSHRNDQNLKIEDKLTTLQEDQALKLVYELATAMEHLKYNKIVHKNLNTHNIRVKRQNSTYKILVSLFGPTLYSTSEDGNTNNQIDDERFFAPEVLRFQKFSHSSDVYSFALICWEIVCVGATVYQTIPTTDLFGRIKKGIRPEKYSFISEDFYQLLLNSWDLDPNERLDFSDLVGQLKHFLLSPKYFLNYSLDGPLPFYLPLLEFSSPSPQQQQQQ